MRMMPILIVCLSFSNLASGRTVALAGHGGSTPDPLYQVWLPDYNNRNPEGRVYYMPVGTAESIKDIKSGIGDFGGGEMPLTDRQMMSQPKLVNLPIAVLALVPIYNIEGFSGELRLTGPVLAKICMGTITLWNDPAIAALNPGAKLPPGSKITFIHRAPGKAMNYVLTDYLSKVSSEFKSKVGRTDSPNWPVGVTADRQEDVPQLVRNTPNSIGYGEIKFAQDEHLKMAVMRNSDGEFVTASPETISAAVQSLEKSIPRDFRLSFTNATGRNSYPIVSFTWLYVPIETLPPERARVLADFIEWVVTSGQTYLGKTGFAPLPSSVVTNVRASLAQLRK